jgi:phenylacetic acid degradation operon negative regulatory protein
MAAMRAKTEELLYMLLWASEVLWRPTFRNFTGSFEGWAYRNGLLRQVQRLKRQKLLEVKTGPAGDRLHRLSEAGRLRALGGRDPEACWRRRWDKIWRMALFDVPQSRSSVRNKIRHHLQSLGFGYLQNSVWITPNSVQDLRDILADGPVEVEMLILLEARPCAGESDAQIVAGAWDFDGINQGYARHQEILMRRPRREIDNEAAAKAFRRWLSEERESWLELMAIDPLLPEELLPEGYAGREAWALRKEVMRQAGSQMRVFELRSWLPS